MALHLQFQYFIESKDKIAYTDPYILMPFILARVLISLFSRNVKDLRKLNSRKIIHRKEDVLMSGERSEKFLKATRGQKF